MARGKRRDIDMCSSGVKLVIKKKKKFTKFSKNKSCKVRMILTSVITDHTITGVFNMIGQETESPRKKSTFEPKSSLPDDSKPGQNGM